MREYEVNMLHDTLRIVQEGCYTVNGRTVPLKHTPEELAEAIVCLPDEIEAISAEKLPVSGEACAFSCVNADSYVMARRRIAEGCGREKPVLVLNFANPVNPGGGVRRGAHAQEEDLCRKSSLLVSLESEAAKAYYLYNKSLHTYLGSDAVILSPAVEILRDEHGALLDEPVTVAVLTCAAPMICDDLPSMTEEAYRSMLLKRINGMLIFAASRGYRDLVLGAWGCGAFGNDAEVVSDLFHEALKTLRTLFSHIDFAVLCRGSQYNFTQFARYFSGAAERL